MSEAIIAKRKKSSSTSGAYLVTELIDTNTTWVVPSGIVENVITVRLFGGGGAGCWLIYDDNLYPSAGGGGCMNYAELNSLQIGSSVRITIGKGGYSSLNTGGSGGTTSFGTFLSANGGEGANAFSGKGGSGGSGGFGYYGGDGYQFGGGGGIVKGGNGGIWGGGGGSACNNINCLQFLYEEYIYFSNRTDNQNSLINLSINNRSDTNITSGGIGGIYGGNGSNGYDMERAETGTNVNFNYSFYSNRFFGNALGGWARNLNDKKELESNGNICWFNGIVGGGGGGYGGNGSNGSIIVVTGGSGRYVNSNAMLHEKKIIRYFAGGGGGGYGAHGDDKGGGGGYFTNASSNSYGSGGAGYSYYGKGGNLDFYGTALAVDRNGTNGVCIIQYYV